eukprot:6699896-Prymnesium_polylepis.2
MHDERRRSPPLTDTDLTHPTQITVTNLTHRHSTPVTQQGSNQVVRHCGTCEQIGRHAAGRAAAREAARAAARQRWRWRVGSGGGDGSGGGSGGGAAQGARRWWDSGKVRGGLDGGHHAHIEGREAIPSTAASGSAKPSGSGQAPSWRDLGVRCGPPNSRPPRSDSARPDSSHDARLVHASDRPVRGTASTRTSRVKTRCPSVSGRPRTAARASETPWAGRAALGTPFSRSRTVEST